MIQFKKYRRTLMEIEAMQFNYCDGDKYFDKDGKCLIADSLERRITPFVHPIEGQQYEIESPEGCLTIEDGGYLAKDVNGNYYSIAKSVFEQTYKEEISDEELGRIAREVQKDYDLANEGEAVEITKADIDIAGLYFSYNRKTGKYTVSTPDYKRDKWKIEHLIKENQ